ncbi:MAG: hypothetical protein ACFCUI_11540 [Bernardetiaceae bacterium]
MNKKFLFTCDSGLEHITCREVKERFPEATVGRYYNFSRRIIAEGDLSWEDFLSLRSIQDVIEIRQEFVLDEITLESWQSALRPELFPELDEVASFRVTSDRWGNQDLRTMDMQAAMGSRLIECYGLSVELDRFQINIRADLLGSRGFVGIQHTRQPLSKRGSQRPFHHKAGLKPTIAYAMLQMAEIQAGHTLLDPMCGSGTILLEAAECLPKGVRLLGGELRPEIAEGAQENITHSGYTIELYPEADARHLGEYFGEERVDRVVCNLPYGIQSGKNQRIRGLYEQFLSSLAPLMPPESKVVLLTARPDALRHVLLKLKTFKIITETVIESGGLYPHIFQLEKIK